MEGFKSKDDVKELLAVYTNPLHYYGQQIVFSDKIIDIIWTITKGHPQFVQEVCYACYLEGLEAGISNVSEEVVYKTAFEIIQRSPPELYPRNY